MANLILTTLIPSPSLA